jgi:hypothetical protein
VGDGGGNGIACYGFKIELVADATALEIFIASFLDILSFIKFIIFWVRVPFINFFNCY